MTDDLIGKVVRILPQHPFAGKVGVIVREGASRGGVMYVVQLENRHKVYAGQEYVEEVKDG